MKIVSISPGGLLAVKPKKPGRPTSVNIKRLSMPRPTSRAFKFHDLPFFDEEDEDTDELILTNENGVTIVKLAPSISSLHASPTKSIQVLPHTLSLQSTAECSLLTKIDRHGHLQTHRI